MWPRLGLPATTIFSANFLFLNGRSYGQQRTRMVYCAREIIQRYAELPKRQKSAPSIAPKFPFMTFHTKAKKSVAASCLAILVAGCVGFHGQLKGNEQIQGHPVGSTVLIVEEEYSDDGNIVPAGTYYPNARFSNGKVVYVGRQPLTYRKYGWAWMTRRCQGGVSVDATNPYLNPRLVFYDCFAPMETLSTSKPMSLRLEFR